jgi:hypothetical protein
MPSPRAPDVIASAKRWGGTAPAKCLGRPVWDAAPRRGTTRRKLSLVPDGPITRTACLVPEHKTADGRGRQLWGRNLTASRRS